MENFLKSGNWEVDGQIITIGDIKYQIAPDNLLTFRDGKETEFFSFEDVCALADTFSCENAEKLGGWRLPTLAELKLFEACSVFNFHYHAGVADCAYGISVKEFAEMLGLSLPGNLLIVGAVASVNHDGFTGYWANPVLSPGYMKLTKRHISFINVDPDETIGSKKDFADEDLDLDEIIESRNSFGDEDPNFSYGLCVRLIRQIP